MNMALLDHIANLAEEPLYRKFSLIGGFLGLSIFIFSKPLSFPILGFIFLNNGLTNLFEIYLVFIYPIILLGIGIVYTWSKLKLPSRKNLIIGISLIIFSIFLIIFSRGTLTIDSINHFFENYFAFIYPLILGTIGAVYSWKKFKTGFFIVLISVAWLSIFGIGVNILRVLNNISFNPYNLISSLFSISSYWTLVIISLLAILLSFHLEKNSKEKGIFLIIFPVISIIFSLLSVILFHRDFMDLSGFFELLIENIVLVIIPSIFFIFSAYLLLTNNHRKHIFQITEK
jgi:hypothetical protein